MDPLPLVPALVLFLHDLFTVVWIGGILFTALVLMPALRAAREAGAAGAGAAGPMATGSKAGPAVAGEGPLAAFTRRVQALQSPFVIASVLGLSVTGVLLARVNGVEGIFRFDTPYHVVLSVKHVLVIALVAMSLVRRRVLSASTFAGPAAPGARASAALLAASAATGVVILALSALNAAMR